MDIPVINYVIVAIALLAGVVIALHDKSLTKHDRILFVVGLLLTAVAVVIEGLSKKTVISFIAYVVSVVIVVFTALYINHRVQKRVRQGR